MGVKAAQQQLMATGGDTTFAGEEERETQQRINGKERGDQRDPSRKK